MVYLKLTFHNNKDITLNRQFSPGASTVCRLSHLVCVALDVVGVFCAFVQTCARRPESLVYTDAIGECELTASSKDMASQAARTLIHNQQGHCFTSSKDIASQAARTLLHNIYIYIYIYIIIYIYIYNYIHIYIYNYTYIYTYKSVHTYTHNYTLKIQINKLNTRIKKIKESTHN